MANKTVYPFGQNGSLPSGYPIADDLETNSAQQALSAKQGVRLKKMVEQSSEEVTALDLSSMPTNSGVLTASNVWSSTTTNHQYTQIPVRPGQKYRIVANANTASYYAFFASASFWKASKAPNFTTGYDSRYSIANGETEDVIIPEGTNYLYVALLNGGTNQTPQSISLVESVLEITEDNELELRNEVFGNPGTNLCNYETDVFSFSGSSSAGTVTKVGVAGYMIKNKSASNGKYFLYTLPEGMVDGKTYLLSFDYTSWLTAAWNFNVVGIKTEDLAAPSRNVAAIPASGSGHITFRYTYLKGDMYLRLPSSTQGDGCALLIENLSIVPDIGTLSSLAQRLDLMDGGQNLPSEPTWKKYVGRRVDFSERSFGFRTYMSNISTHQSSACYGDYLVTFTDKMAKVKLFNLRTKTELASLTLAEKDSLHHCNQAFFGTERYDENDDFPLVYISVNNDGKTAGGYCEVYRIVPTMGESDYNAISIELVQTITLPVMSADNALGNANFVLDPDSGYLYAYSRNNTSADPNYLTCRISRWTMPTLAQGDVTLDEPSVLYRWDADTSAVNMQGAAIKNGQLFIFRGYENAGYIQLHIFDLVRRDRIAFIDLLSNGFTMEPEGVFFWGNTLCVSNQNIIRFFFK